jgi:hypothetical protein
MTWPEAFAATIITFVSIVAILVLSEREER